MEVYNARANKKFQDLPVDNRINGGLWVGGGGDEEKKMTMSTTIMILS